MKLFTVHDRAVDTYSPVVCIPSTRDAQESFKHSVNDPKTAHYKHSSDFTLFEIGEYNQFTGVITNYAEKKLVANASALKEHNNDTGNSDSN